MAITFHLHQISTSILNGKKRKISAWIKQTIEKENKITGNICIILTGKKQLLKIIKKYLKHNYHTDIITFNYNEGFIISGDLFISLPKVKENAKIYNVTIELELLRVIIHGIFHLTGYNDSTEKEKTEMRKKEDKTLDVYTLFN